MNAVQMAEMIDAALFDVPPVCFVCMPGTAEARFPNGSTFNALLRSFNSRTLDVLRCQENPFSGIMPPRQRRQKSSASQPATVAATVLEQPPQAIKKLLHWDDLPRWQRDNHHIHTGYRPASFSFLVSFQSLTYLHNETVNIYSHLLPALVAIPAAILLHRALAPRYETATQADIIAFGCFFAGAAVCLGMSATYHTISNHSPLVARVGNAFDYIGIVCLIAGSFVPSIYYGFYCLPDLQRLYWTMICTIGLGCMTVSIFPHFRTPGWRPFRAAMFVGMGLSAVFPVIHGLCLYGFELMARQIGLGWLLLQGVLYILGAGIYAARVPERVWPGRFDIVGHSHQIFHVLVVCAAVAHLMGLLRAFDYRHSGIAEGCR